MLPRTLLPLLLGLFAAQSPEAAVRFGPIAWSPDGERLIAYNRGKVSELPFVEGEAILWTDSLPEPLALAVDWGKDLLAVSLPTGEPRLDIYRRGSASPIVSLVGLRGRVTLLDADGSDLYLGGPGFFERRRLPEGTPVDSLHWSPPWEPLDMHREQRCVMILLRDRIVRLNGDLEFEPFPWEGEPLAWTDEQEPGLLLVAEGRLALARLGGPARILAGLLPDEEPFGGLLAPDGNLVLLLLRAIEGSSPEPRARIEVRDARTGDVAKRFRSVRLARKREEPEVPRAAAFDPTGRYLAIVWPLAGAQIWDTKTWELLASY
ncbi:MAG: hypothetical protein FJY73_11740 [Candidatus Eisenbacteria bacterium]|nr:hypothetical protein [Candidatus Eisenbacteria bacterium]